MDDDIYDAELGIVLYINQFHCNQYVLYNSFLKDLEGPIIPKILLIMRIMEKQYYYNLKNVRYNKEIVRKFDLMKKFIVLINNFIFLDGIWTTRS